MTLIYLFSIDPITYEWTWPTYISIAICVTHPINVLLILCNMPYLFNTHNYATIGMCFTYWINIITYSLVCFTFHFIRFYYLLYSWVGIYVYYKFGFFQCLLFLPFYINAYLINFKQGTPFAVLILYWHINLFN